MLLNCNSTNLGTIFKLLLLLFCVLQNGSVECSTQIPEILWVFWDSGFEKAPLPVQLSLKNMRHILNGSGWQIRELSNANLHEYIDEKDERQMVRSSTIDWMISDQLRLILLIKYGGVYMDSSCFLLQDFQWLENIKTNPDVVNRYGEYPNVLLFHTTYQSSFQYRSFQGQSFFISPGVESWFIAATPNSSFLQLWLNQLRIFMIRGKEYIEEELKSNNVRIGALASDPTNKNHYFSIYEAFHSVVQKRQHQIDKDLYQSKGKINTANNQIAPLAVQQFGLWFIPAVKGPFKMMLKNNINFQKRGIQRLTQFTQDQLTSKYGNYKYFIKITGSVRKIVNKVLQDPRNVKFSQNWDITGSYACLNNYYFAKGSIFDKYLLTYMDEQQVTKVNVVEKKSLPLLCQQTDIQYIVLWIRTIVLVPVLVFLVIYGKKRLSKRFKTKSNTLLESQSKRNQNAQDQRTQSRLEVKRAKTQKMLKIVRIAELIFSIILTTIFVGSLILALIGWWWQLLSNLVGLLLYQFLFLGGLAFNIVSLTRPKSFRAKLLLRIGTLLAMMIYTYLVYKFNITFDDNLNQDTNNFYLFGVMVGLIGVTIVYWWVIFTVTTVEVLSQLPPIQPQPVQNQGDVTQSHAKTEHVEMAQLL